MSDTYSLYAGDGPIRYTGRVTNIVVNPGWKCLRANWKLSQDSAVKNIRVTWISENSDTNSVDIAPTDTAYTIQGLDNENYQVMVQSVAQDGTPSLADKENKKADTAAAVAKSATKTNTTATVTCTAMARRSLGNASKLIMELLNQGYAADGQVQRSSQPVKPGKLGKVVLPDGTEAYLYASSKLTYPSVFVGNTRDVVLEGEAYFKVTHDASHPFIIHTANATTRVLGTELDVRAFHGEPLHVALITGVAEVVGGNDVCRLKPGEGVTLQGSNLLKQQEDMDVYAYALRGFIYADDAPLENVLTSLAHWYGMSVSYNDRKNAGRRIHFYMRGSDSPERAAELLSSMGAFNISVKGNNFVVN